MKDKILNSRCFWLSKCLIILSIIVLNTSCEKENNPKQAYNFRDYFFIENIKCYDTIGNRFDSLSYMYSRSDFIFSDEFELPYEKIQINADRTVTMHYKEDDITKIKNGKVTLKNDTLYFYSNELSFNNLLFKGLIIDHQLRIPGYGYIYCTFSSTGILHEKIEAKTIKLGIPDLEKLLKNFPPPSLVGHNTKIQNLYIQRFDLTYEIDIE